MARKRTEDSTKQVQEQPKDTTRQAAFDKGMGKKPEQTPKDQEAALMTLLASRNGAQQAAQGNAGTMMPPAAAGAGAALPVAQRAMPKKIGEEQVNKGMQLLRKYKAGKASVERRITAAQEWWKLRNWHEIESKKDVHGSSDSKSNTAWLWNCIVGKHADAMDSFPEPLILPRAMDDKQEAEKLSKIIPVVMSLNGFEQVYSDAQWQKMQEGTAAYGVFWDKSKLGGLGDIAIQQISLLNLFWEPGINDIQDSRNVFYVRLEDNDALEQQYPELVGQLKSNGMTITKYKYDDNVDTSNKSLLVDWYYHRYDGGKKTLHYIKFVGKHVLYATEDDPELAERGLYDDGEYPFVLDVLYPVEGSPCGYGMVDVGKDTQKDIDLLNQAMVTNSVMAATARFFARKDSGINEAEFSDWTKPIVHTNGNLGQDSLQQIIVQAFPGAAINMLQQKIDELKFVTGNTDVNNGGVPTGVTAASAIAALKEDSGRASKDANLAAYRAYRRLINMVMERIRQFYDLPRQFRITGPNGGMQFTEYSNAGIRPQPQGMAFGMDMGFRKPEFDIEVRAQRETAYSRQSLNELAVQLYGMGIFDPMSAEQSMMLLDMMDFKGKDELQQKIQQKAIMQQMLLQYQQIALALAKEHDPAMAEQLANMIMQSQGGMVQAQNGLPTGANVRNAQQAADGEEQAKKPANVQRAEQRAADATRPG